MINHLNKENIMIRNFITALIAAAILILFFVAIDSADAAPADRNWRECIYEDGSGQRRCIWDAIHMGNGEGDSFISREFGDDIRYISHRRAHRLLYR